MAEIRVNVTASKPQRVNVSSSNISTEITATPDSSLYYSNLAKNWAIASGLILNEDYSSKHYAGKAKESENASKNYAEASQATFQRVQDSANDALDNIETNKTSAITEINNTKTTAVNAVNTSKNQALNDIEKESGAIINFKEEVNAELETKVDLDDMVPFEMQEVPCIVETYVNGTSGYNIYSNGYCEQWGELAGSGDTVTVTFIKTFISKPQVFINFQYSANSTAYYYFITAWDITTTSFKNHTSNGTYTNWRACGYIA